MDFRLSDEQEMFRKSVRDELEGLKNVGHLVQLIAAKKQA